MARHYFIALFYEQRQNKSVGFCFIDKIRYTYNDIFWNFKITVSWTFFDLKNKLKKDFLSFFMKKKDRYTDGQKVRQSILFVALRQSFQKLHSYKN